MEEETYANEEFSLCDFAQYFPLPQRVKVTEGYYDEHNIADYEFSNGDILDLRQLVCKTAVLVIEKTGETITVPVAHPALFTVHPTLGGSKVTPNIKTVQKLAEFAPYIVGVRQSIKDKKTGIELLKGDHLRLLRIKNVNGDRFLECKSARQNKLLYLPMDLKAEFRIYPPNEYFDIRHLTTILPRERRLTLKVEPGDRHSLPNVPPGYTGDFILKKPEMFVDVNTDGSPGTVFTIPLNLQITVSPRESIYAGSLDLYLGLEKFAVDNESKFPCVCRLADWADASDVLVHHGVTLGSLLVFHRLVEVKRALLRTGDDRYFSVPLKSKLKFHCVPRKFYDISEIEENTTVQTVKVIEGNMPTEWTNDLDGVCVGQILGKHNQTSKIVMHERNGRIDHETSVLVMSVKNAVSNAPVHLNVPVYLTGVFEEVLSNEMKGMFDIDYLKNIELPMDIQASHTDPTLALSEVLPLDTTYTVEAIYGEQHVLVSKLNSRIPVSFHIPLRQKLYFAYTKKYSGKLDAGSAISKLDTLGEMLDKDKYERFKQDSKIYSEAEPVVSPIYPPSRLPFSSSLSNPEADSRAPPVPRRSVSVDQAQAGTHPPSARRPPPAPPTSSAAGSSKIAGKLHTPGKKPAPPPPIGGRTPGTAHYRSPPPPVPEHHQTSDDEDEDQEYEDVRPFQMQMKLCQELIGTPKLPNLLYPSDNNLSGFSCEEMLVFLIQQGASADSVKLFKKHEINGRKFAALTDEDLQLRYKVSDKISSGVKFYRNQSKRGLVTLAL